MIIERLWLLKRCLIENEKDKEGQMKRELEKEKVSKAKREGIAI